MTSKVVLQADSSSVSERAAWNDPTHAVTFDYMHSLPAFILRRHVEGFNEGRLFRRFAPRSRGTRLFEVGCATGELQRYIATYHPRFDYTGFDVSEPAIARAKHKYQTGKFFRITDGCAEIEQKWGRPDVVWCRDVVMHQEAPFDMLDSLIRLTEHALFVRLRTRDVGQTVDDPTLSCQLHWDRFWVPYIVVNTDEVVRRITAHNDVASVVVARSYEVLGGHNLRFLPKELFFTSAKTAETAIFIEKGRQGDAAPIVSFQDRQDRPSYSLTERAVRRAFSFLGSMRGS